jgi:hypothetical protein
MFCKLAAPHHPSRRDRMIISNEIMVLLEGIELSTSPLPKHCSYTRALVFRAFPMRAVLIYASLAVFLGPVVPV